MTFKYFPKENTHLFSFPVGVGSRGGAVEWGGGLKGAHERVVSAVNDITLKTTKFEKKFL